MKNDGEIIFLSCLYLVLLIFKVLGRSLWWSAGLGWAVYFCLIFSCGRGRRKVCVCSSREFRLCLREITCCSAAPNSRRFPPYSLLHLIQFLSAPPIFFIDRPSTIQNFENLDRPSTIQISKIWIESKNSRSNFKKIKLALNLLDPILRKKLDRNLLDPIFKK